jgi:hypothetical protein
MVRKGSPVRVRQRALETDASPPAFGLNVTSIPTELLWSAPDERQ